MFIFTNGERHIISPQTICRVESKALTDVGNRLLCLTEVTNMSRTTVLRAWVITLNKTSVPTGGRWHVMARLLMETDLII